MKMKSIKTHLKAYSILEKRKTTIAHAFASALAPTDEFNENSIKFALEELGQFDFNKLHCVYCIEPAETWDHLTSLVKDGEFNGYGHQIGNLVPCCKDCNSKKGGALFNKFIETRINLNLEQKNDLIGRLMKHQTLAKKVESSNHGDDEATLLKEYRKIQDNVLELLDAADKCAYEIRNLRSWPSA